MPPRKCCALGLAGDIEKDSVGIRKHCDALFDKITEIVQISVGIETYFVVSGFERAIVPAGVNTVAVDRSPGGIFGAGVLIYSGSEVYRNIYSDLMAGVDLLSE